MNRNLARESLVYLTLALIILAVVAELFGGRILGFGGRQFAFAAIEFGFLAAAYLLKSGLVTGERALDCPPYCPPFLHAAAVFAFVSIIAEIAQPENAVTNLPIVCAASSVALSALSMGMCAYGMAAGGDSD